MADNLNKPEPIENPEKKEAVKTSAPVAATPTDPKTPISPVLTPAPAKASSKTSANNMNRRQFISWFGLAWTTFAAATGGALALCGRFMFPNVLFEPKSNFKIGFPEDFELGNVDLRFKDKYGVWIIRNDDGIYALSTVCTHLGCPPNWQEAENKFKCPCHGSGFYKTGINFEGPAPRPLERFRILLAEDGQVMVDKSKKFQQEKGQWTDAEAFLYLA